MLEWFIAPVTAVQRCEALLLVRQTIPLYSKRANGAAARGGETPTQCFKHEGHSLNKKILQTHVHVLTFHIITPPPYFVVWFIVLLFMAVSCSTMHATDPAAPLSLIFSQF